MSYPIKPVAARFCEIVERPRAAVGLIGGPFAVLVAVADVGGQDALAAGAALKLAWTEQRSKFRITYLTIYNIILLAIGFNIVN